MGNLYCKAFTQCKTADLVAVCDLDPKRASRLARAHGVKKSYSDCGEMLAREELDAVTVATPDFCHRAPVIACLQAGKDVLCEKPLATTMEDCRAIAAAVRRSRRKLMVNYGNRHRANVRAIRDHVQSGRIGKVQNVFIHLREQLGKTRTLAWAARTTPTFFLLSHCTDTVRWIVGGMATEAHARASYGALRKRGLDTPDTVAAMLTFDNGAVVTMDASWTMPDGFAPSIDFRLEVLGEKGALYADLYPRDLMAYDTGTHGLDHSMGPADPFGRTLGWWLNSCGYFVECIERDVAPEPTVDDGLKVTQILLAIEKACRTGGVVRV